MRIIFSFFLILLFSSSINAQKIATIKISYLISNSIAYIDFINKLNITKLSYANFLKEDEKELKHKEGKIQDSKLILDETSLNNLIENYNKDFLNYQNKVNNFNLNIDNTINSNQKIIINEIIPITQILSDSMNIDIILNEDQYFLSSYDSDISDIVLDELNKKTIKLKIFKIKQ